jgi:KaiC/GvpD/RAD55 family RecA-like ATPase
MYDLGPSLDDRQVEEGTNLLLTGAPLVGKSDIGFDVLEHGLRAGDGAIVVSTRDGAGRVLEERSTLFDHDGPVGVIDCVSRSQGAPTTDDDRIRYVSSPEDMTGIGIEFSELLEGFYADGGRTRVLFHSLTPLLLYSDVQTVFRFLHVFCNRVSAAEGLGLYVLQPDAHDERTLNTLRQLFDGVVTVEEGGETDVRLTATAD